MLMNPMVESKESPTKQIQVILFQQHLITLGCFFCETFLRYHAYHQDVVELGHLKVLLFRVASWESSRGQNLALPGCPWYVNNIHKWIIYNYKSRL